MENNNDSILNSCPSPITITESECDFLVTLLSIDLSEISAANSKDSDLLKQVSRNRRCVARLKFSLGLLDEISMAQELAELDEQYNVLLLKIRDRALVKGQLLKIRNKLVSAIDMGGLANVS